MEIEQYVEQFELEEEKLRALRERISALKQEEAEKLAIVEGWRVILRGHGWNPPEKHNTEGAPKESMSEFLHAFVMTRGVTGATTRDILAEARSRGMVTHASWPYTELSRLLRRGLLIKDGKRYYSNMVDRAVDVGSLVSTL